MIFFLFKLSFQVPINLIYDKSLSSLQIKEDIIEHQICQGFFKLTSTNGYTFEVSIRTNDSKLYYFYKEKLIINEETHFSFNNVDPQLLIVEARPVPLEGTTMPLAYAQGDLKLQYNFEYQFDTFNKEVAKDVRIQPTVQALTHIEKLLYEVYQQTESRGETLRKATVQHNKIMRLVIIFNIGTLLLIAFVNSYQMYSMKKFFKKKKLI